jgi:hypothetical protein
MARAVQGTVKDLVLGRESLEGVVQIAEEKDEHGTGIGGDLGPGIPVITDENGITAKTSDQILAVIDEYVVVGAFRPELQELQLNNPFLLGADPIITDEPLAVGVLGVVGANFR